MQYSQLDKETLVSLLQQENKKYDDFKAMNLKLDISRGKPCSEQLDLSMPLFDSLSSNYKSIGNDYRNYGLIDGIPEFKTLFGSLLGIKNEQMIVGGNSSLNMMYDCIQRAMQFGILGATAWNNLKKVKFLCPVPGYDRHFSITQLFNIDMISIPMNENGPIMEIVEELVANDDSIKGMWCVPKYANPTGIVYSDEVVDRLASMKTAAVDFRIMWDNAYFVHSLYEGVKHELKDILTACQLAGNPNRVFMFGSTSKITFPGAGVAFMASSVDNINEAKKLLGIQTIGPDKINQLMHVEFFKQPDAIIAHMNKHSAIIRPKFEALMNLFDEELADSDIFSYTKPLGGYFISVDVLKGCAKEVCNLCKNVGLILTPAGSTYPMMIDDNDSNLRIAPTFAKESELVIASNVLITCIKIACIKKILSAK